MGTRVFIDTNVLVYLYDQTDVTKQQIAAELLLDEDLDLVISTQVLSEFFVVVTRKIKQPLTIADAIEVVEDLSELEVAPLTRNLVVDATRTAQAHQLSYWDALIIETASQAGTDIVMTEDLNPGAVIRSVELRNPFAPADR